MKIHDVKQSSPEWYAIRSMIPTASEFDKVITPKTMKLSSQRHAYACRIIAARLMNWQADSLDRIEHIANGKANEPFAVAQLELVKDVETTPIGFVTTSDGRFGASPDRVVMRGSLIDTTVEVKCPTIPVQFERLLFNDADAYRAQRQGQLWVAEADKAIFYSFCPGMPAYMVETGRDDAFIKAMADAMEQFSDELEAWTEKAKSLGGYSAFSSIKTPVDVAALAWEGEDAIPGIIELGWGG